jgi:hypothetical protein
MANIAAVPHHTRYFSSACFSHPPACNLSFICSYGNPFLYVQPMTFMRDAPKGTFLFLTTIDWSMCFPPLILSYENEKAGQPFWKVNR